MIKSKLSKFYLVSSESFNKINKLSEMKKKKKKTIRNNNKNDIDYFSILKNLQRKKTKSNFVENETRNSKDFLVKTKKYVDSESQTKDEIKPKRITQSDKSTQTLNFKHNNFATQTKNEKKDKKTQTNWAAQTKYGKKDAKTQTDWEEDANTDALTQNFNKSLSFLEPIEEEDEDDDQNKESVSDEDDEGVNELTIVERNPNTPTRLFQSEGSDKIIYTTPVRSTRREKLVERMQTTPARSIKRSKRFASPLLRKVTKERRIKSPAIPIEKQVQKQKKFLKAIEEMKLAKVTNSRKAKEKAWEKIRSLKWKHI